MLLRAPRRWAASPLGLSTLLSALKQSNNNLKKYAQIDKLLKNNNTYTHRNQLFISSSSKHKDEIKRQAMNIVDIEEIHSSQLLNCFFYWVHKNVREKRNIVHDIPKNTDAILANVSLLKLIEFPLENNFKLVIILPNEADVLHTLFAKLNNEGLFAAVNSIQPLFTTLSELRAPNVEFNSKVGIEQLCNSSSDLAWTGVIYGNVNINENGTTIEVLTCLFLSKLETSRDAILLRNSLQRCANIPWTILNVVMYSLLSDIGRHN